MSTDFYRIATDAIDALKAYGLQPTERNYAVMQKVLLGQPPELVATVQDMAAQKLPMTQERMDFLHATYLGGDHDKLVQESAATARKLFADMLMSIQQFTGSTGEVGASISSGLATLSDVPTEEELRRLASSVVQSAAVLKESGTTLNAKLEASQKEIVDLRENLAKVTVESEHDFLTHTYNRKAFDTRLNALMAEANAEGTELTLLMLDVDHFKKFNDTFGHLIGDEVLKIVARTLTDSVKGMDTVARYGGEEFAVILPKTPVGGGMIVGEAIRRAIASRELKRRDTGANYGQITVSIGVAALRRGNDSAQSFIQRADEALYRAKKSGRNKVMQENLGG